MDFFTVSNSIVCLYCKKHSMKDWHIHTLMNNITNEEFQEVYFECCYCQKLTEVIHEPLKKYIIKEANNLI